MPKEAERVLREGRYEEAEGAAIRMVHQILYGDEERGGCPGLRRRADGVPGPSGALRRLLTSEGHEVEDLGALDPLTSSGTRSPTQGAQGR